MVVGPRVHERGSLRRVPHDNDPVVISVVTAGRKVHRVLVDQGSSADVMFLSTFNKLRLSPDLLRPYTGCLYGFADNQVEVRGYLELRTTFTDGEASRIESIRYLVVNANSAYNILLVGPALNRLNAVSSTRHMKMKMPDLSGKVIVIKSDQEEARKCYENSLKLRKSVFMVFERPPSVDVTMIEATPSGSTPVEATPMGATPEADTLMGEGPDCTAPAEEATPIQDNNRDQQATNVVDRNIGGKTFKLGRLLSQEEQEAVAEVISRHLDAFAWSASDMPDIDPDFLCHHLSMDATVRPVRQRRRKFNEKRQLVVREETQKLLRAGHIREIQYPEWLANVVLVKKANGKWRMCVDFTDLNKACPKDSYPLPSFDALVDSASGCKVMPFGLKNAGATYQRLMDKVLAPMLGRNVYAYVDDMVVASKDKAQHVADLEELFVTISKYRLKLNPEKCVFGVEAGRFLGFMLTERGIEANPDKCAAIFAMRSPTSVKEVQQLTGRMAALSRFVSAGGEKGHPNFQCLKRNSRFAWTDECETAFIKLKEYLAAPPVLCKPVEGVPLRLYFTVTERAISSVLVQEQDQIQRPIYFKPDVAGRMVRWAVELSEFDIQYKPRGSIKGQVYADFVAELSPGGEQEVEAGSQWSLSVDGSSNQQGSGAGIVLEGPDGVLIEQALRFPFKASNNQAEYEALIAGMLLAKEMGARNLLVKSDSQRVTGQVLGEFQAKDPQMAAYLRYVELLKGAFNALELVHVPRE
ncbi:uncharacterized protein [Phaseolus vulgaris]|uniref:uncharacterized protein n=1 Tax=Phaseolus vulgaris TaxID=3885 RepID=UPI0035C98108